MAEITRFHPQAGACLYDTERGDWVRDAEGYVIKVDRATGKPVGEIVRCKECGAVRKVRA